MLNAIMHAYALVRLGTGRGGDLRCPTMSSVHEQMRVYDYPTAPVLDPDHGVANDAGSRHTPFQGTYGLGGKQDCCQEEASVAPAPQSSRVSSS